MVQEQETGQETHKHSERSTILVYKAVPVFLQVNKTKVNGRRVTKGKTVTGQRSKEKERKYIEQTSKKES